MSDLPTQFVTHQQGFVGTQQGGTTGTVIGYGDPVPTPGPYVMRPGAEPIQQTVMAPEPILASDIDFSDFDQEDMALLAVDLMTVNIGDYDLYFDENNQIRPGAMTSAVNTAIRQASDQAEFGLGEGCIGSRQGKSRRRGGLRDQRQAQGVQSRGARLGRAAMDRRVELRREQGGPGQGSQVLVPVAGGH